ncbi:MAG: hypothetical protein OHK0046_14830 [Anaerolineae bacterium]
MDDITSGQIIIWLIVGALVGSLVGRLVRRRKRGFGTVGNITLGLVGAVVGGLLFNLFDITIGSDLRVTATDLIAAFVGSLLVVALLELIGRR